MGIRRFIPATAALLALGLSSCGTVHFYGQAAAGQWEIMRKSRPSARVMSDPETPPELRKQLAAVERIRTFAKEHLGLPGDESYGRYADLGRPHVVWVLYAAPEFSLEPKTWWYPTLGTLDYRGYFREEDSESLAAELRGEGYDVAVGGTDAYSTLGWLHDPVLNTFVHSADVDLAELIFHELTHRKLFRNGDTAFNESLANAVGEEGVRRWLRHEGRTADLKRFEARLIRRAQFYDRIDHTRGELTRLYASGLGPEEMRRRKAAIFADLQDRFRELRRRWGGRGLESWLTEDINNAHLISIATYHEHIPDFQRLLAECRGDLDLFFKRAEDFQLPKE